MPRLFKIVFLLTFAFVLIACRQQNKSEPLEDASLANQIAQIAADKLTAEYLSNPIHLDIKRPRLSWQFKALNHGLYDQRQTAYQILVASSVTKLQKNEGDMWDSGRIESDQSVAVLYRGRELNARKRYFWKVKIWDAEGAQSQWSDIAYWQMALLDKQDWQSARWIGIDEDVRSGPHIYRDFKRARDKKIQQKKSFPSPLLRKSFTLQKKVKQAVAYISGLGYHEFYLNGQKVGDRVLEPGQTNYDKSTFYITHDITNLLNSGDNVFGIWLGNGFFGQNIAFTPALAYGPPRAKAILYLDYQDGSSETVVTDASWKASQSPILFDNVYGGETYDARMETAWINTAFDDSDWQQAVELDDISANSRMRSQLIPPIRKQQTLKAIDFWQVDDGSYVFDFGKNIAGWVRLEINEKAGTEIKIAAAETIFKDSKKIDDASIGHHATGLRQIYHYIARGDVGEHWEPKFSYHGFQYVQVSGLIQEPTQETVQAVFVHSDVKQVGGFTASDEMLNKIYQASLLTAKANMHSVPEDCPHREKCGWLGDAHANAQALMYSFELTRFYLKYLEDIRESLVVNDELLKKFPTTKGVPPLVAPGKRASQIGRLDWQIAIIYLPYYLYLQTGDLAIFEKYYPHMQDFIAYQLDRRNKDGVIEDGLGDWCPPRWDRHTAPEYMVCRPIISANAMFIRGLNIVVHMADKMGDAGYTDFARKQRASLIQAFNRMYLEQIKDTELKYYGSQTATLMALSYGIVPESEIGKTHAGLLYDINELNNGEHTTGFFGLSLLYSYLAENGESEKAFNMFTSPRFPSPAYIINSGLNTWPERQWEYSKLERWTRSLSHPYYSQVANYLHRNLLGIQLDEKFPAYKHATVKPYINDQLAWVRGHVQTPFGQLSNEWAQKDDSFVMRITIPINTKASVYVPLKDKYSLSINGETQRDRSYDDPFGYKWQVLELGSGSYTLLARDFNALSR